MVNILAMDKAVTTIEEWLQDCDTSDEAEHLNSCFHNGEDRLIYAIFLLFEEKSRYPELFESTVKQLFVLARSKDGKLRDFVFLFVPCFIFIYLSAISTGDKKSVSSVEITLLSLYNTEVLSDGGVASIASFRLPTLARNSIFHDRSTLPPTSFSNESLRRLEVGDAETVRWGPPKHITTVTAATRYHLATALLVAFNARLSKYQKIVLQHLCKSTSKIVCQGFNRPGHHHRSSYGNDSNFGVYPHPTPRIPVTSDLLAELVHAVYFSMFNDLTSLGLQALEDIHVRSQYELFADVLLMTNGIKNSLKINPSGQPSEGLMGINIAIPPTNSTSLSKSCITNASFRTKKLPDDIPIQAGEDGQGLTAIHEDLDGEDKDIGRPIKTPRDKDGKEKTKLSSNLPLTALVKKREKEKCKNGDRRDFERKSDKERKSKQDRDKDREKDRESNRNEPFLNRNSSSSLSVDLSLSANVSDGVLKQTSPQQQLIEMKPISKGNVVLDVIKIQTEGRIEEQSDVGFQSKTADMNGTQNQVGMVA